MNESDIKNHPTQHNYKVESYDDVPYPSYSYTETHPNKLATTAIMFGMNPAPVDHCRVLELGCGSANNLIGMAVELTNSEFVGIDLSKNEVKLANDKIHDLNLKNITVKQFSITDITPDFGKFDYIIAHGVYSWVPPQVREHILNICKHNLNENGVAYISYNTYPGWHLHEMLRNMMLYHVKGITDPKEATQKARKFLEYLAELRGNSTPIEQFLKNEVKRTKEFPDNYFYHDQLAEYNQPFYFHEFARDIEKHGLKYLRECDIQVSTSRNFKPKVSEMLNNLGDDVISIEQHMDFILERMFRETLICHKEVELQRLVTVENIKDFYFVSLLEPAEKKIDLSPNKPEKFISKKCPDLTLSDTFSKAIWVFMRLMNPKPLNVDAIMQGALRILNDNNVERSNYPADDEIKEYTLANLMWGISMGFIQCYTIPTNVCIQISEKPCVSALTRYDAKHGNRIINELHENFIIDNLAHHILPLLDGTNDFNAILANMVKLAETGKIKLSKEGVAITNPEELKKLLKPQLELMLQGFAKAGVLTG